ncbi:hypothetical protein DM860_011604 [Cuscuta australis]|uniref:EF-hand domain-containing protein n=1 Tax=Cuscuta australis TaxID=267555 RepID=A0A328D3H7_9ASTE|nr:hypothetical protein DM860_011604 [Cuscuta australis]
MSIVFIDGPTIEAFVNDKKSFHHWVDESFNSLDVESKGELSREAFENRPGKFGSREFELQSRDEIKILYNHVFEKFDVDKSGTIDRQEFRDLMEEIILAKARCIGKSPVLIILQGDSSLMGAVQCLSETQ